MDTIYKLNKWIFGHVCICVNIYKHAFFKFHPIQHELQCASTRDSRLPLSKSAEVGRNAEARISIIQNVALQRNNAEPT